MLPWAVLRAREDKGNPFLCLGTRRLGKSRSAENGKYAVEGLDPTMAEGEKEPKVHWKY